MSDTATDLTPTEAPVEAPPLDTAPVEETPVAETPLNVDDDAAVDAALQASAIDLPDGDKLVATSQAGKIAGAYRGKIKELKAELENVKTSAAEAATLKEQIAQLQGQVQQLSPYMTAYQQMQQAAQQTQAPSEDDAEAEEYAKVLDLWTPDGKPDIERGKRALALADKRAKREVDARVAPIHQQTAQERSSYNLARAQNTVMPNGTKADPAVLKAIWSRLDPSVTATPEGAQQALMVAVGYSVGLTPAKPQTPGRGPNGQFQQTTETPDPIFTEKAGGKDTPASLPLSDAERKYLKDVGMTEKEYLAATPPWMRK